MWIWLWSDLATCMLAPPSPSHAGGFTCTCCVRGIHQLNPRVWLGIWAHTGKELSVYMYMTTALWWFPWSCCEWIVVLTHNNYYNTCTFTKHFIRCEAFTSPCLDRHSGGLFESHASTLVMTVALWATRYRHEDLIFTWHWFCTCT